MKKLTFTILSMSLLTVMAGAAVAPALGAVRDYFADANSLLIQFVLSMPALFIILTNLLFPLLCRLARTRTIAVIGLVLYVVAGAGAFFADNIYLLLALRALLGVSVGMLMPLSTGLLAYYFPPEQMARLMGLSAAMNQMGGVVATLLAGMLATIAWNYAFLVYLIGLLALVLVLVYLPNEKLAPHFPKEGVITDESSPVETQRAVSLQAKRNHSPLAILRHFHPSIIGMLLLMTIFFVYPTNFALVGNALGLNTAWVTGIMVGLDVVAFFVGLVFGGLMQNFRTSIKYFAPIGFLLGYTFLAWSTNGDADGSSATIMFLLLGSAFIGLANGVGVPYLNTIASIKGGKDSTTTVMPLLSAALYLGQFISPLIVLPLSRLCFHDNPLGVWIVAIALCLLFLLQTFLTRRFHRLPPKD